MATPRKHLTGRNWDEVQAMLSDPSSYIVIFVSTHGSVPQPSDGIPLSFTVPNDTFILSSSKFGNLSNTAHADEYFKVLQPNGIQRSFDFFFGRYGNRGEKAYYKHDKKAFDMLQCAFPGEQAVNKVISYNVKERLDAKTEQEGWGIYILDPALPQPKYTAANVQGKNAFFEMNESLVRLKFNIDGIDKPIVNLFKNYTNAERINNIMQENYKDRIKLIFFESCAAVYDDVEDPKNLGYANPEYDFEHYAAAQRLWNRDTFGLSPDEKRNVFDGKPDLPSFITSKSMNLEPEESNDSLRLTAFLNHTPLPKRTPEDIEHDAHQRKPGVATRSEVQEEVEQIKKELNAAKEIPMKETLENVIRKKGDHLTRSQVEEKAKKIRGQGGGKRTRRNKAKRRKTTRRR